MTAKRDMRTSRRIIFLVGLVLVVTVAIIHYREREDGDENPEGPAGPSVTTVETRPASLAQEPSPVLPGPETKPPRSASPPSGAAEKPATERGRLEGPEATAGGPPEMEQPESPPELPAQMHQLVRQHVREGGPTAGPLAEQLLESDNPLLRATGAALLSELGRLNDELLSVLAGEEDPYVAMTLLGWLRDMGHFEDAERLSRLLVDAGVNADAMVGLLHAGSLEAGAGRAALDLVRDHLEEGDALGLYASLAEDPRQSYSVRMKALLLMRETLPFVDYRTTVQGLRRTADAKDNVWSEGLRRLAERLAGPAAIHEGALALHATDIDLMLAREYPEMLEDLALWVEFILGDDSAAIQIGSAQRLREAVARLEKRPWTEEQALSLRRLQTAAEQLAEAERARGAPLPSVAPPGAGQP